MFEFKFADIGEGIHEGKLLKWMFEVGDEVKDGDTLFLVETDKVNAEIPSPVDGKISEKLAEEGDIIHVGDVVVKIDEGEGSTEDSGKTSEEPKKESVDEGKDMAGVVGELEVGEDVLESSDESDDKPKESSSHKKVLATPVARKLAKDLGIDITTVNGSGTNGRVMKEDIYKASEQTKDSKEKVTKDNNESTYKSSIEIPELKIEGEVERVQISKMRKTIAKNMVLSKTVIPHASSMDDFDVTELVRFRKDQKHISEAKGTKLTYMPFIMKAVTLALKEFPIFNSSYDEKNEEIVLKKYYNIGIAVDTPEGLMVPVIKDTDRKGILEISQDMNEAINKSKDRTLGLDKLRGGTFSITNYGAVGSTYGVPVIKHPEVAILGIGKITKKPVVIDEDIVIRDIMPISISIDHRVIDGADAGRFLNRIKEYLQDPMLLLLS